MSSSTPASTGYQVCVDGYTLNVPSNDRCWDFMIVYNCRCPVTTQKRGIVRNKTIRVKQDNHIGSCTLRRCVKASQNHVLPDRCTRCNIVDARYAGVKNMNVNNMQKLERFAAKQTHTRTRCRQPTPRRLYSAPMGLRLKAFGMLGKDHGALNPTLRGVMYNITYLNLTSSISKVP
ncbi:hypothetical protein CHU98_g5864 [Xylaria longipes]|nr:hypothetical protein CHU98_g5864 [Xylaria longipes]